MPKPEKKQPPKKVVEFGGNNIEGVPVEIVQCGGEKLYEYFTREKGIQHKGAMQMGQTIYRIPKKLPWRLPEALHEGYYPELTNKDLSEANDYIQQALTEAIELPFEAAYDIISMWIIGTWMPEVFETYPYLHFIGDKVCGKSKALKVLKRFSYRGVKTSSTKVAVLARLIENKKATLLLDEFEYNERRHEDILEVLNAGNETEDYYTRCYQQDGVWFDDFFEVAGFKALAGRTPLPDTLDSRCITVPMRQQQDRRNVIWDTSSDFGTLEKLLICRNVITHKKTAQAPKNFIGTDWTDYIHKIRVKYRIEEIYLPILYIAKKVSQVSHKMIKEHLEEEVENYKEDEKVSQYGEIVNAICRILESYEAPEEISSGDIATVINEEISAASDRISSVAVGKIMVSLGFKQRKSGSRRIWQINEKLLEEHKKRYVE